jgi:sensor histidine kinase YesM
MNVSERIINFNKEHRILSHVLFWIILLLIQLSSSSYYNADQVPFRNNIIGDGTNLIAQIPSAYLLAYFIVPVYFYKQKYTEAFLWFTLTSYIICALSRIEVIYIEEPFYGRKHNPSETITEILTDILKLIYVYFFRIFSVAFIFMFLKLLKDQLVIQKRTLSLEKEKAETELKLLKSQLNPHFLFNTLNNIYSLSLNNSPVTSTAIARLSEILDYILYKCNSLYVPVEGEIALLKNYIGLEELRYDKRLNVSFKTNVDQRIEIAPLVLLSIVENAFKHGAANQIEKPVINIELNANDAVFSFKVSNSFHPKPNLNNTENIGLPNLKHQLELIYPEKHSLKILQTELLFTVILNIYPS